MKAGLEKDKAALLVVLAALSNGQKVILAVVPGHRESTASWSAVLRDLKARGLRTPRLVIGDGHLGIWAGLRNGYPDVEEQRCWNHKSLNVLDKLPKRAQPEAKVLLWQIPYAPTCREAERRKEQFVRWCEPQGTGKPPPVWSGIGPGLRPFINFHSRMGNICARRIQWSRRLPPSAYARMRPNGTRQWPMPPP